MNKDTDILLAALKQAVAEPGEHRLYKSGKLSGLFPGRSAANAAAQALQAGLLAIVRTETRGKTTIDWVSATPSAVNFLREHESPVELLRELQAALQTTREGVPLWLADLRLELQKQGERLGELLQGYVRHLEGLSQRVEATLRRLPAQSVESWTVAALGYLDRRRETGAVGDCALPELFAAVRQKHPELSLTEFHDGLRRLQDRRALQLLPADLALALPEPEHAMLDGDSVYYFARRTAGTP